MSFSLHSFHIPVMGLAFTVDTPLKVARFGIDSVISIVDDVLLEAMRKHYCSVYSLPYDIITDQEVDHRAKRITAYLNMVDTVVKTQILAQQQASFDDAELRKYFELLPETNQVKKLYRTMEAAWGEEKERLQIGLRKHIRAGAIDVNIMTKVDKTNYSSSGVALAPEFSDAMAALRGFAQSTLESSVVFSAGMNPRLYGYCESFADFFPDPEGRLKKKIIIKVSDYRSALIQGKFFAKKGLWVSEFRIESGLNCGGHAFATDGILLGPVMEEFRQMRQGLTELLFQMCNAALKQSGKHQFARAPVLAITAQGGMGTSGEHQFLMQHYGLDRVGWGSPFLLVPEATTLDAQTLTDLSQAQPEDYFLSDVSPLGVPFNNFSKSSSERQRKERIAKNRPGSPCYLKFLSMNTEFSGQPLCVASRQYQDLKLKQVHADTHDAEEKEILTAQVVSKDCLCEGLSTPAFLEKNIQHPHKLKAVAICPGPNLAYFSGVFSLNEMVGHIYGKHSLLNKVYRPHVFINELHLYIEYLKKEILKYRHNLSQKRIDYFTMFRHNLMNGIQYYHKIIPEMLRETVAFRQQMVRELAEAEKSIQSITISG